MYVTGTGASALRLIQFESFAMQWALLSSGTMRINRIDLLQSAAIIYHTI